MRNSTKRVRFCVIQYRVTDVKVCCRSVDRERGTTQGVVLCHTIHTDINVCCRSVDGGDRK